MGKDQRRQYLKSVHKRYRGADRRGRARILNEFCEDSGYAIGVIAYELLAGRLPYKVDKRVIHGAMRIIREEEPTSLSSINRSLRGDVETILGKALEKEKTRRYESADAFASDIRHYLKNEPIAARPASTWYQTKKFAQRHKATVVGLATAFVLLAAGLVVTSWQAARARAERDRAERVVAFMDQMLSGAGPSVALGRDTAILREMMDAAALRIEKGELKHAPGAELKLRGTIGDVYRELAEFPKAAKMLEPAPALARSLKSGDSAEAADALALLGILYKDQADFERGEPVLREAAAMMRRLSPSGDAMVAGGLRDLAVLLADRGNHKEAEPLLREALAMYRGALPNDDTRIATLLTDLGATMEDQGKNGEAEALHREALTMNQRLFPGDHPETATSLNNLAVVLRMREDPKDAAEARELFRTALEMNKRLLPGDHPNIASGINNLASFLQGQGQMMQAEALYRESLAMRRRLFPGDHTSVATGLANLALLLQKGDNFTEAESMIRDSLGMRRRLFKGDHPSVALDLNNLSLLLRDKGDFEGSLLVGKDAVDMFTRTQGPDYWLTGYARMGRGRTLIAMNRFAEAEKELLEAERVMGAPKGVPAGRHQRCLEAVVQLYEAWNKADPRGGHAATAATWKAKLNAGF